MLAFLRKLLQSLFVWNVSPASVKELKQAQVIIAVSFGTRKRSDGDGLSNISLARYAAGYRRSYGIPVITQGEVYYCPALRKGPIALVVYKHSKPGKYLDTYDALAQAVKYCRRHGYTRALLVAHPHHMLRCKLVLEKMDMVALPTDTWRVPYDPKSAQVWTRSARLFILREILARLMYLLKGWM